MKPVDIRFFSSEENSIPQEKNAKMSKVKKVVLKGYISTAGKIVFPAKTVADLGIDIESGAFRVGMQEGKRKAKSLYMVPANGTQADTFQFEKAAKSYTLSLPFILKKNGVDFSKIKHVFTINLFDYDGVTAFELQLGKAEETPKVAYTGKPRGRKPKETLSVE